MDIRQLRYYVCIVDSRSLSKAAERLCIAQPSLSSHVAQLESELGTQLLFRSPQGVRPTEAGQVLYRHARGVLAQMAQIREDVRFTGSSEAGKVSIGLPTSVNAALSVLMYDKARLAYPGVYLQVVESSSGYLEELLVNGRLDMALLFRAQDLRGLFVEPLLSDRLSVFGHRRYLGASSLCEIAELNGVPMVLPSSGNYLRVIVERAFAEAGVQLNVVADMDSLPALLSIAHGGSACTIVSSAFIDDVRIVKPLEQRLLVRPEVHRTVSLCRPSSIPLNSASNAFYHFVVRMLTDLVEKGTWAGAVNLATEPDRPAVSEGP